MRVTQSMLNRQMLQNLKQNNSRMDKYQDMLSTGKQINKPADDPVGVSFAMRYKSQLGRNDQYMRNLDAAKSNLEITETALSKINDVLQRARELAIQGGSDTTPDFAKKDIAVEISQLKDELLQLGNTRFNGKYIFNGQRTDTAPYPETAATPVHEGQILLAVSDGVNMQSNVIGKDVFGSLGQPNEMFRIMDDMITGLQNNDSTAVTNTISKIDQRMDSVHLAWADVGARMNRLELVENRLKDGGVNLTKLRSQVEDADMSEVITNLKMAENVQRASLATGARVLQTSLVDFLR